MTNEPITTPGGRRHRWTRGDRLRVSREHTSPSQEQFARILGFSKNTVARYERDEKGADKPIVLIRWAEVTGYDLRWLQFGDEDGDGDDGGTRVTGRVNARYLHHNPGRVALELVAA